MGLKNLEDDEPLLQFTDAKKGRKKVAEENSSQSNTKIIRWIAVCLAVAISLFVGSFFLSYLPDLTPFYVDSDFSTPEQAAQEIIIFELEKLELIEPPRLPSFRSEDPLCELVPNELRFDCLPQGDINEQNCEARGCCWNPPTEKHGRKWKGKKGAKASIGIPYCFYTYDHPSYFLSKYKKTDNGFEGVLERDNSSANLFPAAIPQLRLQVFFETVSRLHVKISDLNNPRYEVPLPKLPKPPTTKALNTLYDFSVTERPFSFQVRRKSTGTIIFDTSAGSLSFYDQFLEISSFLPSRFIYGLGEHTDRHFLHSVQWSKFTFWTTDIEPDPTTPLYGVHPFYLSMEEDGKSNGVLLFNSNGMDVILQPTPAITYRPIGGVFDFYIFLGPQPNDVVSDYISLIGKPALPPYWALGFHLCRWGYKSLEGTKAVTDRNIAAGIPLDVQWNDIDYMDGNKDFTLDPVNFQNVTGFVEYLHAKNMRYVVIVDPGISSVEPRGTYQPFEDGLTYDVFVKNASGGVIEGRVWTGKNQAYPDFTHPNATAYWTKQIKEFRKSSPVDGIWIDMNEPSDFVDGSVYGCPASSLETPPYFPQLAGRALATRTLCMTAKQSWGLHYNLHNLYGITEAMVTQQALLEVFPNKRPFIISRSSFTGQGQFSGHWSGDQPSDWFHLQSSIADMLSFNMYGMPLMGADICGFGGDTTEELCLRWQQVGAFYPFSRNHNAYGSRDQDPASFAQPTIDAMRNALLIRYSLFPYYSSLFFRASLNGSTVVRPLFFEFADNLATYSIDEQFLIGSGILVSPVLTPNTTSILAYFPDGVWYDFYSGGRVDWDHGWQRLNAPNDTINLHLRGGSIIPTQKPEVTTAATRINQIELIVALDENGSACGELFWDDGEQFDVIEQGNYSWMLFKVDGNSSMLTSNVMSNAYKDVPALKSVRIHGVAKDVQNVYFDGENVAFTFDRSKRILLVDNLDVDLLQTFTLQY